MNALLSPTPEQERPRVWVALSVALGCFALGLTAVFALPRSAPKARATTTAAAAFNAAPKHASSKPEPRQPQTVAVAAPEPIAAAASGATEAAPSSAAIVAAPPKVTAAATPEPIAAARPEPVTATPEPTKAKADRFELRFIQGRVAYLRCDGLGSRGDRFPCPRDAALETAVWEVLATLPKCMPSLGRGGADIRLDLSREQSTQVRVLAINGAPEPALNTDQVSACVAPRLAKLKTALDPLYMMVSFRASLR